MRSLNGPFHLGKTSIKNHNFGDIELNIKMKYKSWKGDLVSLKMGRYCSNNLKIMILDHMLKEDIKG